jgi:rRNA maturation endonuclease Nob1
MSEYRHVVVCHDCNTKSIFKLNSEFDICSHCGSDNVSEYIEQDIKGKGLNKFLDGKTDFVR